MPCYHKLLIISGRGGHSAPRLQAEDGADRLPGPHGQPAGHSNAENRLHRPPEQLLPNVISSTEGALLAKMADRGQLGNVVVDGPLSLDVALYKGGRRAQKVKGSSVAGDPDCLLFPNLESANVFFKSVSHLCGGELAAMVMGTKVPCVLTSRGDMSKTKLFSIRAGLPGGKKIKFRSSGPNPILNQPDERNNASRLKVTLRQSVVANPSDSR